MNRVAPMTETKTRATTDRSRILLVEDSEHDRRFFIRLIEQSGEPLDVTIASNSNAALDILKRQSFDLLISDLNMPGMDGLELIEHARPYLHDSGALILTGSLEVNSAAQAVRLGILDYILKEPREVLRDTLVQQINAALRQVRLMRENRRLEGELKRRLAHLEQIQQLMPESLFATLDRSKQVIEINEQARSFLGLESGEAMVGRDISELLGSLGEMLVDSVRSLIEERKSAKNLYLETSSDEAPRRLLSLSLDYLTPDSTNVKSESGAPWCLLGLRDITPENTPSDPKSEPAFHGMIGGSREVAEVREMIRRVAPLPITVLVTGPTGSGKEVVANAIHAESDRASKPFIAVNCTALSGEILESELFGHVRGAFTGAINARKGRFREADGGTLFLDEIGDTTESFQSKLLRALDAGQIEPVGQDRPVQVNVRLICATNKDLEQLVREGKFREDLFYRVNVVHIFLPPLRERIGDLPLLVERFRQEFNQRFKKAIRFIAPEAMRAMALYDWPGNIRELRHVLERAFVVAQGPVLGIEDLPPQLNPSGDSRIRPTENAAAPIAATSQDSPNEIAVIKTALEETRGNIGEAAIRLGMHRTTLWRKMRQYHIEA